MNPLRLDFGPWPRLGYSVARMPTRGLLAILALLLSSPALAQAPGGTRVAVERFRGPQSGGIRNALIQDLQDNGVDVVSMDEVSEKARELFGRTRLQDDDYPQVAQALGLTAFVDGRVSRQRRRWGLRVRVRNAADGMILGTARWGGRTVGSLRAVRRNGHGKLQQYLQLASSPAPPQPEQPPPPDPNAQPWYQSGEEPAEGEGEPEEEEEDDAPRPPSSHDGIRVGLLVGTLSRSMSTPVTVDPSLRPGAPAGVPVQEVREYQSGGLGHMEVGVTADLFPGAFLDEPVAEWLGISFSFRNSVLLETSGPACDPAFEPVDGMPDRCQTPGGLVPIDSLQREFYIGGKVDYGLNTGAAGGPWIQVDLGYGNFKFQLDTDDLALLDRPTIVAPMDYSYVHIGGGVKLGLHEMVLLGARFGYRQGFSIGTEGKQVWGVGTSGFRGWQIGADLVHHMDWASERVYAALTVEYFRFRTEFSGPPACYVVDGEGLCNNGSLWEPVTFQEAVDDSYLRLGLTIGYHY